MSDNWCDKWDIKINPPTFNEFLKTEIKCSQIDIEKINKTINSKKLELTIKESDLDKSVVDNFMKWVNIIRNQNNVYDKVMIRKLTKRYPYKSKRKRLIKKWWKNHSELIELNNVTLTPNIKW